VSVGKLAGKWILFADVANRAETRGRLSDRFGGTDGFGTITYSEETVNTREDELELARERGTAVE
jgi:hypothetical protein